MGDRVFVEGGSHKQTQMEKRGASGCRRGLSGVGVLVARGGHWVGGRAIDLVGDFEEAFLNQGRHGDLAADGGALEGAADVCGKLLKNFVGGDIGVCHKFRNRYP